MIFGRRHDTLGTDALRQVMTATGLLLVPLHGGNLLRGQWTTGTFVTLQSRDFHAGDQPRLKRAKVGGGTAVEIDDAAGAFLRLAVHVIDLDDRGLTIGRFNQRPTRAAFGSDAAEFAAMTLQDGASVLVWIIHLTAGCLPTAAIAMAGFVPACGAGLRCTELASAATGGICWNDALLNQCLMGAGTGIDFVVAAIGITVPFGTGAQAPLVS